MSVPAVAPVPVREIPKVALDAFEVMETLPLLLPPDVGAKVTLKVALWPAASVNGGVSPLMLKAAPLAEA